MIWFKFSRLRSHRFQMSLVTRLIKTLDKSRLNEAWHQREVAKLIQILELESLRLRAICKKITTFDDKIALWAFKKTSNAKVIAKMTIKAAGHGLCVRKIKLAVKSWRAGWITLGLYFFFMPLLLSSFRSTKARSGQFPSSQYRHSHTDDRSASDVMQAT